MWQFKHNHVNDLTVTQKAQKAMVFFFVFFFNQVSLESNLAMNILEGIY